MQFSSSDTCDVRIVVFQPELKAEQNMLQQSQNFHTYISVWWDEAPATSSATTKLAASFPGSFFFFFLNFFSQQ